MSTYWRLACLDCGPQSVDDTPDMLNHGNQWLARVWAVRHAVAQVQAADDYGWLDAGPSAGWFSWVARHAAHNVELVSEYGDRAPLEPERDPPKPLGRDALLAEISRSLRATHPERAEEMLRWIEAGLVPECEECHAVPVAIPDFGYLLRRCEACEAKAREERQRRAREERERREREDPMGVALERAMVREMASADHFVSATIMPRDPHDLRFSAECLCCSRPPIVHWGSDDMREILDLIAEHYHAIHPGRDPSEVAVSRAFRLTPHTDNPAPDTTATATPAPCASDADTSGTKP